MTEFFTSSSLPVQLAVVVASVAMLKQWLRGDQTKLEGRVAAVENILQTKAANYDLEKLDSKFTDALARLANTIETFVRSSQDERFRAAEVSHQRDTAMEVKVGGLEIAVANIGITLSRVAEQVDKLTLR